MLRFIYVDVLQQTSRAQADLYGCIYAPFFFFQETAPLSMDAFGFWKSGNLELPRNPRKKRNLSRHVSLILKSKKNRSMVELMSYVESARV